MKKIILFLILSLAIVLSAWSQSGQNGTIELKDGQKLSGVITKFSPQNGYNHTFFRIDNENGTIYVPESDVKTNVSKTDTEVSLEKKHSVKNISLPNKVKKPPLELEVQPKTKVKSSKERKSYFLGVQAGLFMGWDNYYGGYNYYGYYYSSSFIIMANLGLDFACPINNRFALGAYMSSNILYGNNIGVLSVFGNYNEGSALMFGAGFCIPTGFDVCLGYKLSNNLYTTLGFNYYFAGWEDGGGFRLTIGYKFGRKR